MCCPVRNAAGQSSPTDRRTPNTERTEHSTHGTQSGRRERGRATFAHVRVIEPAACTPSQGVSPIGDAGCNVAGTVQIDRNLHKRNRLQARPPAHAWQVRTHACTRRARTHAARTRPPACSSCPRRREAHDPAPPMSAAICASLANPRHLPSRPPSRLRPRAPMIDRAREASDAAL
jgi:hypothetical protein